MSKETIENVKKKGLTTNQKIMIGGFTVLTLAVIIAAIIIIRMLNKPTAAGDGNLVIDNNNIADISDTLKSEVEDGLFELNMNMTWHFHDTKSASYDAYVANSGANHYAITFDVIVENETCFTSTAIPVGSQIKEIKLNKDLPAGSYPAVCRYHLLREDGTESSSVDINITLEIEN